MPLDRRGMLIVVPSIPRSRADSDNGVRLDGGNVLICRDPGSKPGRRSRGDLDQRAAAQ